MFCVLLILQVCRLISMHAFTRGFRLYTTKMFQQAFPFLFLISSLMFSIFSVSTANSNIYVQCSQLNFASTTPYESNVKSLLASLLDLASSYNFNKSITSPQNDDVVYGLYQCRGDTSIVDCNDCVTNAISQLQTACPMSIGGQIQLEKCFVKYDNTPFLGVQEKTEMCKICGPSGYNSDVLNRINSALTYVVDGNRQHFRISDFGRILVVAQCVQDLSLSDCEECLSEAHGRLRSECETSAWGGMYLGKCYIRYGNETIASKRDKAITHISHNNTLTWVATFIAGFTLSLVLFLAVLNVGLAYSIKKNSIKIIKEKETNVKLNDVNNTLLSIAAESAKSQAKLADDVAGKLLKKLEENNIRSCHCGPTMPMSPPSPYLPHSNPDTCYF